MASVSTVTDVHTLFLAVFQMVKLTFYGQSKVPFEFLRVLYHVPNVNGLFEPFSNMQFSDINYICVAV